MTPAEIRSRIHAAGLTYEQAARRLGVSVFTVRSWVLPETSKSRRRLQGAQMREFKRLIK